MHRMSWAEYSFKCAASFSCKAILHLLFERELYSALHWTVEGVCSQHGGIYIAVRLTCSHFFVPFSCQCLCSSVPLLLSPASVSVLLQLQEMFCRYAQRTSPRDPRIQRKSKMWRQGKETESKKCGRKTTVTNHLCFISANSYSGQGMKNPEFIATLKPC